jgi:iron complex outermembrane receptor protein
MKKALFANCAAMALGAVIGVAPGISRAQDAPKADAPDAVGEVVVSARRVTENLEKVPVADTVVSSKDLKHQDIQDYNDLAATVPSLTSFSTYRDNFSVAIRGQGGGVGGAGAAVETYFDEVPLPRNRNNASGGGGPGSFFDLDSVEVLKGPQGTLFGRNSTGGAVLLTTKKPTNDFDGYIEGGYGSYNNRELSGAVNLPIVDDKLLLRIAATTRDRDGFTHTDSAPGYPNGKWLDSTSYDVVRATLTFKPTDKIKNDIVVDSDNSNNSAPSNILAYVSPGSLAAKLYPGIFQVLAEQQKLGPRDQAAISSDQSSHKYTLTASDVFSYEVTPNFTLRNLFSYSHEANSQVIDADGTIYPIFASQKVISPFYNDLITEEVQARGQAFDNRLKWSTGLYLDSNPLPAYTDSVYVALGTPSLTVMRTGGNTQAVYGQASYAITDKLTATAGLRQTWTFNQAQSRIGLSPTTGACGAPPAGTDATCTVSRSGRTSATTWTLGLDYQLTNNTLAYVASRRGFRDGGFNTSVTDPSLYAYAPEFVTDEEIGVKSTYQLFGDVRARTNADIYHQDYDAVQVSLEALQNGALISYTGNGGDARIWGAEFEGWLYPTRNLEFSANFDWLDFAYTRLNPNAQTALILAQQTNGRPKWKYGFGGRYHLPLGDRVGEVSLGANWNWIGQNGDNSVPLGVRPAYGLLNISADWDGIAGKPIDLSFFMTNALDKVYEVGGYVFPSFGTTTITYGEPRMVGFRVRYSFH